MKIGFVGTGYVGLVAATCFAHMGNDVTCVDVDEKKIASLNKGIVPIYEPGLELLVKKNLEGGRLKFTTNLAEAVANSLFLFIAVGTPPNANGAADLKNVLSVAEGIGRIMNEYKIIINKSTVPVGTADKVRETIDRELKKRNVSVEF
ncbi:MAG: UDP-glucose/GDP-mannose dehydrogenase family protein, partial [Syntrophobacterales bacterium]|nr:UDP-glucose/GDP-mannose dehydrogenase family protein [Syntrophobacterales bacterium]